MLPRWLCAATEEAGLLCRCRRMSDGSMPVSSEMSWPLSSVARYMPVTATPRRRPARLGSRVGFGPALSVTQTVDAWGTGSAELATEPILTAVGCEVHGEVLLRLAAVRPGRSRSPSLRSMSV